MFPSVKQRSPFSWLTAGCLLLGLFTSDVRAQESGPDIQFDSEVQIDPDFQLDPDIDFDTEQFDFGADSGAVELSEEDQAAVAALGLGFIVLVLIIALVSIVLTAWVAYMLMDALQAVPEQHRQLSPVVPWLLFVPIVQYVVMFLVFLKVPDSLSSYLNSVGDQSQADCGKTLGLWGSILYVLGCTVPIGLVLLALSLIKINQAKKAARAVAA